MAIGDLINLSAIDADIGTAGNQAFSFIGAAAFSGTAGELRADLIGISDWLVEADVSGDGMADMIIFVRTIDGDPIEANDFIL